MRQTTTRKRKAEVRAKSARRARRAPAALWRLSVHAACEAEEAVVQWLGGVYSEPVSSYTDLETRRCCVTVWFSQKPAWTRRTLVELRAGLESIAKCGLELGAARVSLAKVRREDWAESWKRHFPPLQVGSALLIRPSWSRRRARQGQALVVLDPGLSFGTGKHPTTAFCLGQLVAARGRALREAGARRRSIVKASKSKSKIKSKNQRPDVEQLSFLDLGTGSGILAIAAAKLGYAPVEAHDFDAEAVDIARVNARRNRVAGKIEFLVRDLTKLPLHGARKFDVVCANLTSDLLTSQRKRILSRLAPGGLLVLAGILDEEFPLVQRAFEAEGLRLTASQVRGEWRSGSFTGKG
jgi:ribosomal protein L11 methyltransferase